MIEKTDLVGDVITAAIRKALADAGRLPAGRDVIVTSVEFGADNGIEESAWAPGYPAEFKKLRIESTYWTIKLTEFQRAKP